MTPKNARKVERVAAVAAILSDIILGLFLAYSVYLMVKNYHIIWGN